MKDKNSYIMVRDAEKMVKEMFRIIDIIKKSNLTTLEVLGMLEYVKLSVFYNFDNKIDKAMVKVMKKLEGENFNER